MPVLIRAFPIRDEKKEIIGAAQIFRDNSMQVAVRQRIEELAKLTMLDPVTEVGTRKYLEINLYAILDEMRRYD